MLHLWPGLRTVSDGEYLGALTYLNPLVKRTNWLYGQAHTPIYGFRQAWSRFADPQDRLWHGETPFRAEHPNLMFSARINLDVGGAAYLEYMDGDGNWTAIAADGVDGDRWFNGTEDNVFDCSALDIPDDGILHLRFYVSEGECPILARAWMQGEVGLTPWPAATLVPFYDGVGNEPDASGFNALKLASEYLFERSQAPANGGVVGTVSHTQEDGYLPFFRTSFLVDGRKSLHYDLSTWAVGDGKLIRMYLNQEKYPATGYTRLNSDSPIADFPAEGRFAADIDLTAYGLDVGDRIQIEIGAQGSNAFVGVHTLYLHDLVAETRTDIPASFEFGERPGHASLNEVEYSLDNNYPAMDRESPLLPEHYLQSFQLLQPAAPADYDLGFETYMRGVHHYRVRILHRWRYLRYRCLGTVRLRSADGTLSYRPPDTEGAAGVIDLEGISWLAYGMEYEVQDEDLGWVICAYEDYDA